MTLDYICSVIIALDYESALWCRWFRCDKSGNSLLQYNTVSLVVEDCVFNMLLELLGGERLYIYVVE